MIVADIVLPFLLGGIAVAGAASLLFLPPLRLVFWRSTRALVLLLSLALLLGGLGLTANPYYLMGLALVTVGVLVLVIVNAARANALFKK